MGEGRSEGSGADDDPFAELRAAGFFDDAPREPSAEERAATSARRARQIDLQRRLAEEAEHERRLAERDRRTTKRGTRPARSPGTTGATRATRATATTRTPGTTKWSVGTSKYRNFIAPALVLLVIGAMYTSSQRNGTDPLTGALRPPATRPPDYPPIDTSVADDPLGTPPPAPTSPGPFEPIRLQKSGDAPVAWDPCRPIRYVVNSAGAPPGAEALLADAIARTSTATGLVFVHEGATDEAWAKDREPYQPDRYGEKWAPALIAWTTQAEVPGLAGYIAGLAGPAGASDPSDPTGTLAWVTGQVALDAEDLGAGLSLPGGDIRARAVIQHELGHLVGLDHVADPAQLMYSEGNDAQVGDWGSGDLAGLHELGKGECLPGL